MKRFACETLFKKRWEMQEQTFNIGIEASVLSSIIFEPSQLDKYGSRLHINLFYLPNHQKILNVILERHKSEKTIDEEIIKHILGSDIEETLLFILQKNPIHNLDDYLEILQDFSTKREMQNIAFEIGHSLESNMSGIEIQAKITNLTKELVNSNPLEILEIQKISEVEDKEVDFICQNWLPVPVRTVSLITAPGGTGKSWLVMQLAIRALEEGRVQKVFLWLSEDPKEISKNRFNKIFDKVVCSNNPDIKEKIAISDSPTIQFLYEEQRRVEVSPLLAHFKAKLQDYDLIILDPLIAFYGTDENNNAYARRFMQLFTDWANKENKTIVFIHHSTKNTTQSRGASAFVDAVRSVYELDKIKDAEGKPKETNKRVIKLTKDNYGISNILGGFQVERELFPHKIKHERIEYDGIETTIDMPSDF